MIKTVNIRPEQAEYVNSFDQEIAMLRQKRDVALRSALAGLLGPEGGRVISVSLEGIVELEVNEPDPEDADE